MQYTYPLLNPFVFPQESPTFVSPTTTFRPPPRLWRHFAADY